jgi:hypothetical protein
VERDEYSKINGKHCLHPGEGSRLMPKSPILGGFSTQRSKNAADNAAFNLGVEIIETKDGKVPGFLFGFSGLDLVGNLGSGPWRGVDTLQDTLYGVSGNEVWSLTPNGVSTLCGTIGSQNSPVSMFANNRQLMIVDGVGAWLVPGGYPFTGGTIESGGGLYALNDTITLQASSGNQTSYPVLTVTGVLNNQATAVFLANAGTTYTSAGGVSTSAIQPQPGTGTGLTITITATVGGTITAAAVDAGGANYATGDTAIGRGRYGDHHPGARHRLFNDDRGSDQSRDRDPGQPRQRPHPERDRIKRSYLSNHDW